MAGTSTTGIGDSISSIIATTDGMRVESHVAIDIRSPTARDDSLVPMSVIPVSE
jgi:hypothetical protein